MHNTASGLLRHQTDGQFNLRILCFDCVLLARRLRVVRRAPFKMSADLPIGLIVLLVLMALCAILGAIYSYIYFTKICTPGRCCPNRNKYGGISNLQRSASNIEEQTGGVAGGNYGGTAVGTHLFLFRKS